MSTTKPVRICHFADAHIDMANYGRHDPTTALPMRVMDFLQALDQIVDTAVSEAVNLVIFAGDAYKDRNPQPTFQREWGRRMMRLSQAGIPTLLLVGNHDVAPASGRAHTMHEFSTLDVPYIHVADTVRLWSPEELGVPVQIITIPWVSRSRFVTREEIAGLSADDVYAYIEEQIEKRVERFLETADPNIPLILTAHASVQGAKFGSERAVMLGQELVISGRLVKDNRLDYVALGHIHKHQALNEAGSHPPVVYPGSIERIDFGEVREKKGFVLAEINKGHTSWEFCELQTRRFIDPDPITPSADSFMADILSQLPAADAVTDAICRVRLTYPRDQEPLLDDKAIYDHLQNAFEVHIRKHHLVEKRSRLGDTAAVEEMTPEQLLETYWDTIGMEADEAQAMQALALAVFADK
ncbi:MAG: exonuclease SbcCD subunit D [Chloroflexi bacterium]|nr:exonuclease SbcCD subunit D [Chloroflexota bacterium]